MDTDMASESATRTFELLDWEGIRRMLDASPYFGNPGEKRTDSQRYPNLPPKGSYGWWIAKHSARTQCPKCEYKHVDRPAVMRFKRAFHNFMDEVR